MLTDFLHSDREHYSKDRLMYIKVKMIDKKSPDFISKYNSVSIFHKIKIIKN